MPDTILNNELVNNELANNSVGIVETKTARIEKPLKFECGKTLDAYDLAYETYGELNASASNAILICHALSGDQHAAGYHSMDDKHPGWWDVCIGPGKVFDTNHFFVVSLNNLGGCGGSTGPSSINPATGKHYARDFPDPTVNDWVHSQKELADILGIDCWAAVAGGSLGGMQALQWAINYPDKVRHAIVIAAAPKLSAQNIAFNEVAREAILSDPDYNDGNYYDKDVPRRGLMLARMLGHITYLSEEAMRKKFGRRLQNEDDSKSVPFTESQFQVQSYLQYQGKSFVNRFDANTYVLMTKVLDYFNPAAPFGDDLVAALKDTQARFLLASFSSDWRFPPERSREIVSALLEARKNVSYVEIDSQQGHDSFLVNVETYLNALRSYMSHIAESL